MSHTTLLLDLCLIDMMNNQSKNPTRTKLSLPLWKERFAAPLAPMTVEEMHARGWDAVDVVFVTGDAYIDHPSFAMAILHRVLEQAGFRVAILSAESEIDKLSTGRIEVREYTAQRPRFDGYALVAVMLWLSAGVMKLGFRTFRTFP